MKRLFLALALIGTAGAAQAQMNQPYPTATPPPTAAVDPYGHRFVGTDNWQRGPSDQGPSASTPYGGQAPSIASQPDMAPMQADPHQPAMKDEFGFKYDAHGNRLNARGNIISPKTKTP
jgi:hypothetical protein